MPDESKPHYPWYSAAQGDELEQGDLLDSFPVFAPPDDLQPESTVGADFTWEQRDLVVMSQSCDMVKGRENLSAVLFCPVYFNSELRFNRDKLEGLRKGAFPGYHLLAPCLIESMPREVRIVEFRRVFTLPIAFVRARAAKEPRLRLMPPYREHLSQAFARFFMRVGLPVDVPSFQSKR
jgi:hypothetical protein